jgi:hydrolethalus syndrome protein 1
MKFIISLVIRPVSVQSTKFEDPSRIRKSNPVNRFHEYSKIWSKQKAPGEKNHNSLRWSIREQMLEKHVIVKKPYRVNTTSNQYTVPTEKRRQDLRWNVRMAMANHTGYSSAK